MTRKDLVEKLNHRFPKILTKNLISQNFHKWNISVHSMIIELRYGVLGYNMKVVIFVMKTQLDNI